MKASRRAIKFSFAVAALLAVGVAAGPANAVEGEEGARKHAAKANQLAAKNRCRAALPEFNRAYRTLNDPTLLFNRAECYRKIGKNAEALRDYEHFLSELPNTPNRSSVEARIASLRGATTEGKSEAPPPAAPAKEPAAPAKEPATPAKQPATPAVHSTEKPLAEPPRRADKWTD